MFLTIKIAPQLINAAPGFSLGKHFFFFFFLINVYGVLLNSYNPVGTRFGKG